MSAPGAGAVRAKPLDLRVVVGALVFVSVSAALMLSWLAGIAVLVFGLVLIVRPLDVFVASVLMAAAGAFVAYGEASVQRDIAIVVALSMYGVVSLYVTASGGRWKLPTSALPRALGVFAFTTALAGVRGVLSHHDPRYMLLEMFPLFGLFFSLAVGGVQVSRVDLAVARWAMIAVALVSASIGFKYFATTGMRTQGLPFSPVPGFVAVVVMALALFDRSAKPKLLPVALVCVMLCHQVVTFTRGFWLGLMVAMPFTFLLYARWGEGARARWGKVLRTIGLMALVLSPVAIVASSLAGWGTLISMLGERFASSFETRNTPETVSNIVRLVELRTTMGRIFQSPWIGWGHGATLIVRQFFHPMTGPQWWVHETYVMLWFKQGIIGLLALIGVLFAAVRLGVRGSRDEDPERAGWATACAGGSVFVAVVGLTNYYFFTATQNFILALLWGIAISLSGPSRQRFVWRLRPSPPGAPGAGAAAR